MALMSLHLRISAVPAGLFHADIWRYSWKHLAAVAAMAVVAWIATLGSLQDLPALRGHCWNTRIVETKHRCQISRRGVERQRTCIEKPE